MEACWLWVVGNAQENFMKLLATTSTRSKPPFPLSYDRKSMANSSIGSLARIGTMGALGGSGDFLLIHLSQLAMCLCACPHLSPFQANRIAGGWGQGFYLGQDDQVHCGNLVAHGVSGNLVAPTEASHCFPQYVVHTILHLSASSNSSRWTSKQTLGYLTWVGQVTGLCEGCSGHYWWQDPSAGDLTNPLEGCFLCSKANWLVWLKIMCDNII